MDKVKEIKFNKKDTTSTVTWTHEKPTGRLIHNCVEEVFEKLRQSYKKNTSQEDFNNAYTKIIDKHTKIIDKNVGISYLNLKLKLVKDTATTKK